MSDPGREFSALDMLAVLSFLLGYENLMENREQSRHNDVAAANDRQAAYLLQELSRKFEEQNTMLRQILEVLTREDHQNDG